MVLGGVAGCFLHPYQRLDCGCSCEQRIRIIIILQKLQFDLGLKGSVLIEYTCDAFYVILKRKMIVSSA
jgi:hypothetical protein